MSTKAQCPDLLDYVYGEEKGKRGTEANRGWGDHNGVYVPW